MSHPDYDRYYGNATVDAALTLASGLGGIVTGTTAVLGLAGKNPELFSKSIDLTIGFAVCFVASRLLYRHNLKKVGYIHS